MLNIILFGAPGVGKGTQSQHIIHNYGVVHLSTGDILRAEIAAGTELGTEAKKIMDQGKLVSDEIVIGMIENKLASNPDAEGFIFDGFPRTTAQAVALDAMLEKRKCPITLMLALEVPNDELVHRLMKRGAVSGRMDDTEETILKRLKVYEDQTAIVADHYKAQNKFYSISGVGTVEDIYEKIKNILG